MRTALLFTCMLALSACTPIVTTHGNMLPAHKIEAVVPNVTGRADIMANWGPPTTVSPFDNNTWYYIGETDSQKGIFEHEVEKRQMVKVTFNAEDKVAEIVKIDSKAGRDVDVVDRKTPSAGKEYTAVQQFIGNLGKFNKAPTPSK